jgi:hypothetical protein
MLSHHHQHEIEYGRAGFPFRAAAALLNPKNGAYLPVTHWDMEQVFSEKKKK